MIIILDQLPLVLITLIASWVSYLAGLDIFQGVKQLYLKSQLRRMKSAIHSMFLKVLETPNHSKSLESMIISSEEDLAYQIQDRQDTVSQKIKEATTYIVISLFCAISVAMVL